MADLTGFTRFACYSHMFLLLLRHLRMSVQARRVARLAASSAPAVRPLLVHRFNQRRVGAAARDAAVASFMEILTSVNGTPV